jgi:hypothetical protein
VPAPAKDEGWLTRRRIAGVSTLGGAFLAGMGSLALGISGNNGQAEFARLGCAQKFGDPRCMHLQDDANRRAMWANVLLGVSAAAAATGLTLIVWPSSKGQTSASIVPTGTGAALTIQY